jgi:hypothetical protein
MELPLFPFVHWEFGELQRGPGFGVGASELSGLNQIAAFNAR